MQNYGQLRENELKDMRTEVNTEWEVKNRYYLIYSIKEQTYLY